MSFNGRRSYRGNADAALFAMPYAIQEYQRARDRADNEGRRDFTMHEYLPGGCRMEGSRLNGLESIHIIAPDYFSVAEVADFYSGVIDGGVVGSAGLATYYPQEATQKKFSLADTGQATKKLAVAYPRTELGFVPMVDPEGVMQPFSQYTAIRPAMYTGVMREVVQFLLGIGNLQAWSLYKPIIDALTLTDEERKSNIAKNAQGGQMRVPYDYRYDRSDGIGYVEVDDKKVWWVIQISKAYGVVAMKMELEPATTTAGFRAAIEALIESGKDEYKEDLLVLDRFGGFPAGNFFPYGGGKAFNDLVANGTIVRLLHPDKMEDYTKTDGYWNECGWAFSPDGTKAANTGWCYHESNMVECYFMTLKINGLGTPHAYAEFTTEKKGASPTTRRTFKVPDMRLGKCISFDNRPLGPTPVGVSGPAAVDSLPILVYYKGETLVKVMVGTEKATSSTHTTHTDEACHHVTETITGLTGKTGGYYSTEFDTRLRLISTRYKTDSSWWVDNVKEYAYGYQPSTDTMDSWSRSWYTVDRLEVWDERGIRAQTGVVVPMYDRCAYYLYRRKDVDYRAHTITHTATVRGDPYMYYARDSNYFIGHAPTNPDGTLVDPHINIGCGSPCDALYVGDVVAGRLYGMPCEYTHPPEFHEGIAAGYFKEWAKRCTQGFLASYARKTALPADTSDIESSYSEHEVWFANEYLAKRITYVKDSQLVVYRDYNYWFDLSPNEDGAFQTLEATCNSALGDKEITTYWPDVNEANSVAEGPLPAGAAGSTPNFVGVILDAAT
mgnify:CR=1 FL=1